MRPWDKIIPLAERDLYKAAGLGSSSGLGVNPALLIIDVQYRTVGTGRVPLQEAIKEFPTACGESGWRAVDSIGQVLSEFRRNSWPVLYPYVSPKEGYDGGRLAEKVPAIMSVPRKGYDFVSDIAPRVGDILIPKKHPSAFFGTTLVSYLINLKVDTLIVTGCSTSGCVRGTVVDGFAYNFKIVVPEECVFDRSQVSHAVNLFDMAFKYADVMPVAECLGALSSLTKAVEIPQ